MSGCTTAVPISWLIFHFLIGFFLLHLGREWNSYLPPRHAPLVCVATAPLWRLPRLSS